MNRSRTLAWVASAAAALVLSSGAARAEEEKAAEEDPNTGALSITVDNSFTTAYMFRGILNQRDGLIWQPSIELALNAWSSESGVLRSVDIGMGFWGSYQNQSIPGAPGSDGLYEMDYYPSISLGWAGGVTSTLTYYFYTSPNDTFSTVEEVDVDLAYDDSELLGDFALNPTATFAFESERSSLGGGKGAVFVLGLSPGHEFAVDDRWSINLTLPMSLALSMDDYYRSGGENDVFGYATLGLHAELPIACIPKKYGDWTVTNGLDVWFLNDLLEDINKNDGVYPVWTSSITMAY